ncbi:hypothetical protein IC762_05655 [Bradyrhizobium genosp. L]|uniref:hypothetical protein n=1 Tax=Bradyrhizobium genosp. L TaxID=83637 RepID=UPI0018A2DC5F|nr:hypothetical protein [Bradyrhizobium genosp. L]QPF85793.1 hypothetical protein IC762_05655 [Bradyrhizobium genosp. L]
MALLTDRLDAAALAAELDETGFVCIENAIEPAWIARAQAYVHRLVEQKGKRYFALNWLSRNQGTPPQELTDDPQMRRLLTRLAQIGCPKAKLDEEIYTGLRVVAGRTGDEKSLLYHYDKHVITALAPILIPEGPKRRAGELVVFPNRRDYRRFTLFNIVEKAIVQSSWYRNRVTRKLAAGDLPNIKYLKPGNLYLFWGYRTYHANFPVASDAVRATMLLHYGDPHPSSVILKANTVRQNRDERRIAQEA